MVPLNPTITRAGLALLPQTPTPGFKLTLTHLAIGAAKYKPTGEEASLAQEVARFPIGAGGNASPTSIHVGVTVKDKDPSGRVINDQWIGEIGFYSGETLFAVWSRAEKYLFFKSVDYDVPIAYTLDVSALPAGAVTVLVELGDAAMQAMLFAHEDAPDPHPQYRVALEDAMAAHLAAADPHPQYINEARQAQADANKWAEEFFQYAN